MLGLVFFQIQRMIFEGLRVFMLNNSVFTRLHFILRFLLMGAPLFVVPDLFAQTTASLWQDIIDPQAVSTLSSAQRIFARREIVPTKYRTLSLNRAGMQSLLGAAPAENPSARPAGLEIQLPLPEGGFGRFRAWESPIMEPGLAARFPEIKTYVIQGIDDPTATGRLDMTDRGLRASVLSINGRYFIDPYWTNDDTIVMSYYTRDFSNSAKLKRLQCGVTGRSVNLSSLQARAVIAQRPTGADLRTYRLALAATGEYSAAVATTPVTTSKVLAAMVTSINRVNAVYEREFAIRLMLVSNTDQLIFLNAKTDPYSNNNGEVMLDQNQARVDSVIGNANYDIGHVFSTGGGGIAVLGSVCDTGFKAQGVTGSPSPVGDSFDIDYVAHEIGHQFGANHPFNGTADAVGSGTRNADTAYEPGSGSTIMAYAGICAPQDLQFQGDDYFHTSSYQEIDDYTRIGTGSNAYSVTFTGNSPPVIAALPEFYNIPRQTPFALTASATDANGDQLTYCWEEFDLGAEQNPLLRVDNGASPIFRSYAPVSSPTRFFPSLTYILNNANQPPATYSVGGTNYVVGEILPTTTRTMTFRVSVRDNRAGGGGQNFASTQVRSTTTAGPFKINSPNTATTWVAGTSQTVTWDVSGTTAAPVSCANVKISYSADGGNTFPIVLLESTPNDGSQAVIIPNTSTNATLQGRVKVEAVGNIFFDINDTNFTVTATSAAPTVSSFSPASGVQQTAVTINGTDFSAATAVRFNGVSATSFTIDSNTRITARVPSTATTGPVSVVNAIGAGTSTASFTFLPGPAAPTISSFSPGNGIAGASVVITGTDFSNVTHVAFNGANAGYTVNSSTQITAIVPSGATTGPVSVTTTSGSAVSTGTFILLSGNGVPVISSATSATGTINAPLIPYQIAANNLPTSFSATNLPAGLTMSSSGVISGTPTVSGTILTTIAATNAYGTGPATLTFQIAAATITTTVFSENFASITVGNNTTTGGSNTAWAGNTNFPAVTRAFQAGGTVRLGSANNPGSLTSRTLDLSANGGVFSVSFDVKGWTTVEGSIRVTVTGLPVQTVSYTALMTDAFETKTLNFTGGTASSTVIIETTARRAFVDNVSVFYTGASPSGLTLTGDANGLVASQGSPGTPSSALTIAGTNLTANITVSAPPGFEISKTANSGYTSSLIYSQSGGAVLSSPLFVRIATGGPIGPINGILSASSSSAMTQLAVSGTIQAPTGPTFAGTFPGLAANDIVGGVPALIAYALGGSPSGNNMEILPAGSLFGNSLQITFIARTNDANLIVVAEGSTDLTGAWTAPVVKVSGVNQSGVSSGFERQTWQLNNTSEGFLRVKTTLLSE